MSRLRSSHVRRCGLCFPSSLCSSPVLLCGAYLPSRLCSSRVRLYGVYISLLSLGGPLCGVYPFPSLFCICLESLYVGCVSLLCLSRVLLCGVYLLSRLCAWTTRWGVSPPLFVSTLLIWRVSLVSVRLVYHRVECFCRLVSFVWGLSCVSSLFVSCSTVWSFSAVSSPIVWGVSLVFSLFVSCTTVWSVSAVSSPTVWRVSRVSVRLVYHCVGCSCRLVSFVWGVSLVFDSAMDIAQCR